MNRMQKDILVAKSAAQELMLHPRMANRHGLIAGATGTGKSVTLRVLAEGFSRIGVPVFMADVKGDLAGICMSGSGDEKAASRAKSLDLSEWQPEAFPVVFWDLFGKQGHPIRTTISEIGPVLLSRLLNLNEVQSGVLNVVFRAADEEGFLLLDLKDLRAMLQFVGEHAKELTLKYGNISSASVGAIQRNLLVLEEAGGDTFFGEPALNIADLLQSNEQGRGVINILAADTLIHSPLVYSTFLLWLLSELFEQLPETGDPEKPRLVFFFDEAHLLFDDAPKALVDKIEQVVRLIRSKGVGIYFVSQSPLDVPDEVLGQLGNRVQHALRAFTARDQKAVRAAAETFRSDGSFSVEEAISELAIGEALVSCLADDGTPTPVQRALIVPPASRLGPITVVERKEKLAQSLMKGVYDEPVDRESAYEMIQARAESSSAASADDEPKKGSLARSILKDAAKPQGASNRRQGPIEAFLVSTARSVGSQLGRRLFRGLLGSLSGRGK